MTLPVDFQLVEDGNPGAGALIVAVDPVIIADQIQIDLELGVSHTVSILIQNLHLNGRLDMLVFFGI